MQLHTLSSSHNSKITDKGIKHMQLHTLTACGEESNITDQGIKHMETDKGIKNLQLHTLYASHNEKITDKGIKHMVLLHTLTAYENYNITNKGVEHMQLHTKKLGSLRNPIILQYIFITISVIHILFFANIIMSDFIVGILAGIGSTIIRHPHEKVLY